MRYRRINKQRWIALAGLIGIGISAAASAQVPTLKEILTRLQKNLDQYDSTVPSFFCDEQVNTSAGRPLPPNRVPQSVGGTVTDSTFFLRRISRPDDPMMTLQESREVKKVNGKPAPANSIGGGKLYDGAFTDGLALVSLSQQDCMEYSLKPIGQYDSQNPILIEFASVPASQRSPACRMQEDVSGSVQIDAKTLEITRLQFHAPHHLIGTGTGTWDVAVEYAPVELAGESFWLPRKISEAMADRKMAWVSIATYRKYHLMEATSRILPFDELPAP